MKISQKVECKLENEKQAVIKENKELKLLILKMFHKIQTFENELNLNSKGANVRRMF